MQHLWLSISRLHGHRTKWLLVAYLEAAVVLSFVLEKGCGQLRRLWYRSTGRKSLEEVSEDACVVMTFMNPLKLILIKKMKSDARTFLSVCSAGRSKIRTTARLL